MAMRREVMWLYLALLKDGETVNVSEIIKLYNKYNLFRKEVQSSNAAPSTFKNSLPPIDMPQYLNWIKKYIIVKDNI